MRTTSFSLSLVLIALAACSAKPTIAPQTATSQVLAADTPQTTVEGNTFIAPAEWKMDVRGVATILEAPEGGSRIALVDVRAADADAAVAAARAADPAPGAPERITRRQSV
jgi:hypothetical protein